VSHRDVGLRDDLNAGFGAELRAGLRTLHTAVRLSRDPMSYPGPARFAPAFERAEFAFRALPRPRSTGGGSSPAGEAKATPQPATAIGTVVPVAAPPTSPEDDAGDSNYHEPDEAVKSLVARAQAGDPEAFGELYDRYVDLVYRYVYYRVGSQALAEDLTSEAFLRALRRITSFTWQGRDIGAWFITIARNLIADHFKSGKYRLEVTTADMLDADRAEDGPEGAVLDSLTNATLLEAVKQLNPEQQECVVLRFLQGLSVAETALAMGKNEGAIKALQYRAVRALGRMLPEDLL
jgi:RNA polymerase sigma-70 factor (ECF subfamily)